MNALQNMWSRFFILPALLMLCGILLPGQVLAQQVDANGRTAADLAQRGSAVGPDDSAGGAQDEWKGCDMDDCSAKRVVPTGSDATDGDLDSRAALRSGSLSLQVQPGAPVNSMHIAADGNVGLGTEAPRGRLHVVADPGQETASDILLLDANGNLELGGLLTEASSVLLKEGFVAVDGDDVLARLAAIPITTWNYKTDDPSVRHIGPMAQDFYAAFGLGADDRHIAPLDANGVALAALQALHLQNQTQATRINDLETQNAQLIERLEALEALVGARAE